MSSLALNRLTEERKIWRRDHPYVSKSDEILNQNLSSIFPLKGFVAKAKTKPDGTLDLMSWECVIPGKKGTCWENGEYKLTMTFDDSYPTYPPIVMFNPPIFHPNVYTKGSICLSLLNPHGDWCPSLTMKQILCGIQNFLDEPNIHSPANGKASTLYNKNRIQYDNEIKKQALKFAAK